MMFCKHISSSFVARISAMYFWFSDTVLFHILLKFPFFSHSPPLFLFYEICARHSIPANVVFDSSINYPSVTYSTKTKIHILTLDYSYFHGNFSDGKQSLIPYNSTPCYKNTRYYIQGLQSNLFFSWNVMKKSTQLFSQKLIFRTVSHYWTRQTIPYRQLLMIIYQIIGIIL